MPVRIEPQAEPLPGYRLIERLGGGGFGEVWKCEAPGGLHKAIKFVFGDLKGAGDDGQRAEQELKALNRVKSVRHAYILGLDRIEVVDGQLIIVMELADKNLWDRFKECRAQGQPGVPRDELLQYMEEAAEALDLMNQEYQLQHLDIKPQNLFLIHSHVKVADFGLVKVLEGTQASVTGGVTPVYAAPETFDGVVTRFSDQYSLAICYQELLTGQRPFVGANVRQLIMQHLSAPPNLAPLPPTDHPAVGKALAKKPEDRFPRCRDLVSALRAASPAGPAVNGRTPPAGPTARPNETGHAPPTHTPLDLAALPRGDSSQGVTHPLRALEEAVLSTPVRKPPPEIKGDGCLFPALVVGVGQSALGVLQRLREGVQERFGSLAQLPQLSTLLIDTDPEVMRLATRGKPGVALSASEVLLTQLNRPSYYLRPRDGRPGLESWLNLRMLYRIPRSQVTTGVRALGRLAFCDHYRSIARRLQQELEACTDPNALTAAARQTGLGVRSNRPRAYVVASLAGGTGGGVFLDLAYTLRALLKQLGYAQPDVVGLLLLPPVDRSRSRVLTLGNAYAALTELAHFAHPGSIFHARYHDREPPLQDADPPFNRCVLLPLPEEADEVAGRELAELAGQYLLRDLASPLGRALDLSRAGVAAPPWEARGLYFQTFGLYQIACPRRALLRAAARKLCQRLVQRWMSKDGKPLREAVQTWVQEQWANLGLGFDRFTERLREDVAAPPRQAPEELVEAVLEPMARRLAAEPAPKRGPAPDVGLEETSEALVQLEELVGKPRDDRGGETLGSVVPTLRQVGERLSEEWGQRLDELTVHLIEEPEFRLAGAEECIRDVVLLLEQTLQRQEPLARELNARSAEAHARLQAWLRPRSNARRPPLTGPEVLALLRNFAKNRYHSLLMQQTAATFLGLRGHLTDEMREVNFCRVRLGELLKMLEGGDAPEDPPALCARLLPPGCGNLAEAVESFLAGLTPEALLELDQHLQDVIRRDFQALVHVCLASDTVLKEVEAALLKTAEEFAAERLPEASAAEMFLELHPDAARARSEIANSFTEAAPEMTPGREAPARELCLMATPPGPDGDRFRQLAQEALPETEWNAVASADDILLYRELPHQPLDGLEQLGPLGQDAYRQTTGAENFTPHTRSDITFTR
jgi:serine/threonine protein kinase